MTEMSRGFNFDDFDDQIREALEDNVIAMDGIARAKKRPGEVGGVIAIPGGAFTPEPPEAA